MTGEDDSGTRGALPAGGSFGALNQYNDRLLQSTTSCDAGPHLDALAAEAIGHALGLWTASGTFGRSRPGRSRTALRFASLGLDTLMIDRFPVSATFAGIAAALWDDHGIGERVCLYAKGDRAALCKASGLAVLELSPSACGNVKGVFPAA